MLLKLSGLFCIYRGHDSFATSNRLQAAHTESVLTCNGFGWPHCQQQHWGIQHWGIQLYISLDCRHRKLLQQRMLT